MVSKGIQVYVWGSLSGYHVTLSVPKNQVDCEPNESTYQALMEVDSGNIDGWSNYTGPFTATVYDPSNNQLASWTNQINSLDGNLEGGDLTTLPEMQAVVRPDCIITVGFYDAGSGVAGLPNTDEFFLTVTPNRSGWMGTAAPVGSSQAQKPFTTFVLPSAHDVGMNSMQNCNAILNQASNLTQVLEAIFSAFGPIGEAIAQALGSGISSNASNIITSLAITQKDTLTAMLQTGARYFEFRPAHISSLFSAFSTLPDKLYFTHLVIPGMAFDDFLNEALEFLVQNSTEIIVVQVRFDGIHSSCIEATDQEVASYISEALAQSGNGSIVAGTFDDMSTLSTDQLRAQGKRLIILQHAEQYSTYSDGPYATLDGNTIEQTYPNFLAQATSQESGSQLAVWQCQATSTNITEVAVWSAVSAKTATSTLLCTKPSCDVVTRPWLWNNVFPTMPATTLQAIMNDFFDGGTADIAIRLSGLYLNA